MSTHTQPSRVLLIGTLVLLGASSLANAASATFQANETLSAGKLTKNFSDLDALIAAQDARIAALETKLAGVSLNNAVGSVVQMKAIQTRTQGTYDALNTGDGTEITPLNITITPRKPGNAMVLEWHVNGEANNNTLYVVKRNGVLLTDTTDASNNRWAGLAAQPYDTDNNSTPDNAILRITDFSTLAIPTTYTLHIKGSTTTSYALFLNRAATLAGADTHETSISTGTATEIAQ